MAGPIRNSVDYGHMHKRPAGRGKLRPRRQHARSRAVVGDVASWGVFLTAVPAGATFTSKHMVALVTVIPQSTAPGAKPTNVAQQKGCEDLQQNERQQVWA